MWSTHPVGIDEEGKITQPGMGNPIIDVYDIEEEMIPLRSK